jgi:O-acetyl-ADP-ribose deacetylase (regulator of RNase III)
VTESAEVEEVEKASGGWQRPRPVERYRRWRATREKGRDVMATTKTIDALGGYRIPVQVCPRGCEYHELARRDLVTRTRLSGRVALHTEYTFEARNCPKCGAPLDRECARCESEILAPVAGLCRSCGIPQPWAAERRASAERASVRHWHPDSEEGNDPAEFLYGCKGRGDLWVIEGEVARLDVDAVISNDDVDGQMWSQVARSIKNAAGPEVEQRAQDGKPYRLGQAWLTKAGDLSMEGIIHVASLTRHGGSKIGTVRKCLTEALDIAAKEGYGSIGVAAIGSGPNAIKPDVWYRAFADLMVNHLSREEESNAKPAWISIVLVLFEPSKFEEVVDELKGMARDAWTAIGSPVDGYLERPERANGEDSTVDGQPPGSSADAQRGE